MARTATWSEAYVSFFGRKLILFFQTLYGLGAFGLITFGVIFTKLTFAHRVIRPLVFRQLYRAGLGVLPMIIFLALALGLIIIGQTVSLLNRYGATKYMGVVMVTVVVRELGPMLTGFIVLLRTGTATVVELGTARALGEVEALEVLGIDPVHYFVVPRVIGMGLGLLALTIYMNLGALVSGYLWAFVQDVPLTPAEYFQQLAQSLHWIDFVVLGLKALMFGSAIAVVTCYHGLAQPLRLEEVPRATVRAVAQTVIAIALIDALFIVIYLMA